MRFLIFIFLYGYCFGIIVIYILYVFLSFFHVGFVHATPGKQNKKYILSTVLYIASH